MVYETQINGCKIALLEEGNYYLCDSQFNKIYPISFQDLKHKFLNYFIGKRNDKWALLDSLGKIYTKYIYTKILWFEADLFLCYNDGWTLVNKRNHNVLNEKFKYLISLKNGIAIFQHQNEFIFVNGYEIILNRVRYINDDASFNGADMALIHLEDGRIGWLKKNGEWHLTPTILHNV
jgi:hypothetical protein